MIIIPSQLKKDKIFYNTILIIFLISVVVFLFTAYTYHCSKNEIYAQYSNKEDRIGPIIVNNAPSIYKLRGYFSGSNSSEELSGTVLNESKTPLYTFSKDFYHESGYDADGYWSESDRTMEVDLNFYQNGNFYIDLEKGSNKNNMILRLYKTTGSYVPHYMVALWLFIISIVGIFVNNKTDIKAFCSSIRL